MAPTHAELKAKCQSLTDTMTVPVLLKRNAELFGDRPALTYGDVTMTWSQLRARTAALSRGLAALGLAKGERMMMMMASRPEHWLIDYAAVHLGAITCTAYQTLSAEQVGYVAKHSGATVVVLEAAAELARWAGVIDALPSLRKVVVLDEAAMPTGDARFISYAQLERDGGAAHADDPTRFERTVDDAAPDDPLAMMYTSGTTGEPKGVVLSHRNAFWEAVAVDLLAPVPTEVPSLAYLPLAHIAERELGLYRSLYKVLHVHICPDPTAVVPTLVKARPPAFFGVPRLWEKLSGGLKAKVATLPLEVRDGLLAAHAATLDVFRRDSAGQPVPEALREKVKQLDEKVMKPVRAGLGLDKLEWASSGSAPIPVDIIEHLAGFGIQVLEVWGMSETTGCATINTADGFRVGSVGRPIPGVDLKLAADGEIFVRGPILFLGYLDDAGRIVSALDDEGWLATGDIGTVDADGYLTITERKKELIITSTGKNVAPSKLEGLLRAHPLVGQAMAIGDRRHYLTALISLDAEVAPLWAKTHGVPELPIGELAKHPVVVKEIESLVAASNERLSRAEQLKHHQVVPDVWSPLTGELTPTLKLKRRVLLDRYAARIDAMYS